MRVGERREAAAALKEVHVWQCVVFEKHGCGDSFGETTRHFTAFVSVKMLVKLKTRAQGLPNAELPKAHKAVRQINPI